MFNRIVVKGDEMVLYNSKTGSYGIKRIKKDNQAKVRKWLSAPSNYIDDKIYKKLIDCEFLVPSDCDEKLLRKYIQTNCVTSTDLRLVVHLTEDCNFRCVYCYMDFTPKEISEDTQQGIVNFIKKNINRFKSVTISWFGGEPLLKMEIIEDLSNKIIPICLKANKPYSAIVTTNGYLLTPNNIERLIKARVVSICVTIDGLKEQHDCQRVLRNGGQTFNKIISNLLYIKSNINRRTLNIIIRSNITINHQDALFEYYEYYNKYFGDDSRFSLFVRLVADFGGDRVNAVRKDFVHNMSEVYACLSSIKGNLKFNMNYQDLDVGGTTCNSKFYNKFTIGCDGSIHKCDESLSTPIGQLNSDGRMVINEHYLSKWLAGNRSNECDSCFFSLCCFMEICPRTRVFENEPSKCFVDFEEIDSLIMWISKDYNSEEI